MKHTKKIVAATLVAALSLTAGLSLTACNSAKEYEFEAEFAEITLGKVTSFDMSKLPPEAWQEGSGFDWMSAMANPEYYSTNDAKVIIETGTEYTGTEDEGPEEVNVGNFYGDGTLMTWKITASADCEATLTLRAASSSAQMGQMWNVTAMNEVVFDEENQPVGLKVNDENVLLSGTLPGLDEEEVSAVTDGSYYRHFVATVTATINLKAGENTVVLVAPAGASIINIDKIIIKSSAKLTYTPADNSDFPDTVQ